MRNEGVLGISTPNSEEHSQPKFGEISQNVILQKVYRVMKVVLFKDVPNVGKKNDVKEVSDGYARNFLLPRNLAKPATEQAIKVLTLQKAREEREKSEEYQKYKTLVDKLKSLVLNFKVKVGTRGRAFGSVTAVKIRDALKKQGIEVEKDWVLLEESIKTSGERMVKIKLPHELMGEIKVAVEAE